MHAAVKRFSQDSTNLQILLLSMVAAALSTQLTSLRPVAQFLIVSTMITLETLLFFRFSGKKYFEAAFATANSCAIIFLTQIPENLAVFSILSLLLIPARNLKGLYLSAFLAHLSDALTTLTSIEKLSGESNPFMRSLMEQIGVLPALILSKFLLVGLPLLFTYFNFKEEERKLFGKIVLMLGLSLSARNLLILF